MNSDILSETAFLSSERTVRKCIKANCYFLECLNFQICQFMKLKKNINKQCKYVVYYKFICIIDCRKIKNKGLQIITPDC